MTSMSNHPELDARLIQSRRHGGSPGRPFADGSGPFSLPTSPPTAPPNMS
jgi:hypothetical protein